MIKDIYIGIDGGGTKTKIHVEDKEGNTIGECRSGPAQIRISVDQAWDSIYKGLNEIFQGIGISLQNNNYRFHVGLALAGTEFYDSYQDFISRPHPFTTICLKSDGYAACLGAHDNQDGSIIIIGTGTKGVQLEQGQLSEVAGWGFPQDDEGGGAWLGLLAIRATLRSIDGREKTSPLCQAIISRFVSEEELLNWSINATSTMYATLAPLVIEHAAQQDPHALSMMKQAAIAIDEIGQALDRKRINQSRELPCCLFGGISPFIQPFLSPELNRRLVERKYGPAKGAVLMVKKMMQEE